MAEAVPKVTVKLKLPNGDVHRAIKSDPTQQARAETKTDELEKEKEEGEGEECSQRKESSPNIEAGSPSALHPERARGQGYVKRKNCSHYAVLDLLFPKLFLFCALTERAYLPSFL